MRSRFATGTNCRPRTGSECASKSASNGLGSVINAVSLVRAANVVIAAGDGINPAFLGASGPQSGWLR